MTASLVDSFTLFLLPDKVTNFALPFLSVGPITVKVGETCDQVARTCLGE